MSKIRIISCVLFLLLLVYGGFVEYNNTRLYQATVADPLFYDPSVDTVALVKSIQVLRQAEYRLLSAIETKKQAGVLTNESGHTELIEEIIADGFLPLAYLESLAVSIATTDRYLNTPNILTARAMTVSNQRTADRYTEEAFLLYRLMNEALKVEPLPITIELFASQITQQQERSDIRLLLQNGEVLQQEAAERRRCLWTGLHCPQTITEHTPPAPERAAPTLGTTTLLKKEIALYGYTDNYVAGPFQVESRCFPSRVTSFYVTIDSLDRFIVKDASESYYLDIAKRHSKSTSTSYLADYQEPYYFQPESTNYRCLDLTYWADIATLMYLEDRMSLAPTSTNSLRALESESFPPTTPLDLTIQNKMTYLPEMIQTIASYLDVYTKIFIDHRNRTELSQLLANRSSYGLTYQPFARSVWRLQIRPRYMTAGNLLISETFVTHSILLNQYTEAELLKFHHPVTQHP